MAKTQHDSETPAVGQQVISAVAFIYKQTEDGLRVFLARRAESKKFLPGVFELPGGHIDFGEGIEAGLRREIMEEFGMGVELGDPFAAFTYLNEVKGSHSVEVIYFARFSSPESGIVLHPEDHSEYVWASEEDLPKLYDGPKDMDDVEVKKILRGFELLTAQSNPLNQ